ncbi:MAG: hypothetical protein ABWY04_09635 [Arthrobacter sp.]
MTRAWDHVIVPACNAGKVSGNSLARAWDAARNDPARPGTKGLERTDLGRHSTAGKRLPVPKSAQGTAGI